MENDYIGFIVAVLIAIGGGIGYFKSGSVVSLIVGLCFAIVLAIGAYFNSQSTSKPLLQLCVLVILAGLMSYRWYNSEKFMPAGLVTTIAAITFVINMLIYYNDLRNQLSQLFS